MDTPLWSCPYIKRLERNGTSQALHVDGQFHSFTIEDAKDGDVVASHECYVIFKEIDGLNIKCYCTYHYLGLNPSLYIDTLQNKDAFYPAVKEQRDFLFQKIKETGYEWDAEKKELKKIEQKPFDYENANIQQKDFAPKAEPKFKVGDLIVHDMSDGRKVIRQIVEMTNKSYILDGKSFNAFYFDDLENDYHLWTIQDAKDGDVLATECFIFIFKNIDNDNGVHYYCHYEIDKHEDYEQFGVALPQSLMGRVGNNFSHYSPASEEQRDFLFQKMEEAGYTWDAEKKELIKNM